MIKNKKELKEYIKYESSLYQCKRPILFRFVFSERKIAWKFVCLLRYEEFHTNTNHFLRKRFYRFLRIIMSRKYSLFIPINVIKKGLLLHHPHNIVINAKEIGENCSIQFNCSFVAGGHDAGNPTIGNNCCFGVGCTVLGDIKLADGIAVGANSLVNKSFEEENIAIAGCPAKKISSNGSQTWGGIKIFTTL